MANRLELTWYGKENEVKIEPRLLIEDKKLSNTLGDDSVKNILIHGDNLLALKSLESNYSNKIKCIYIDTPYNTGKAFNTYDDNIEHSIWLSLMRERLSVLKKLLSNDGVIFIQINDDEYAYLKVLCDEVFGRDNYETTFYVKVRHENRILREDTRWQLCVEQVLCYRKSSSFIAPRRSKEKNSSLDYKWEVSITGCPKEIIKIGIYDVEVYDKNSWSYRKVKEGEGHFKQYQIRGSLITQKGSASEYYEMFLRERRKSDGLGTLYKVIGMGVNGDGLGYRYIMQPEKESSKNGFYFQGLPIKSKENKGLPYPNFYDMTAEFNNAGYEG
ncbi:MAG: DNA methyltransferase, partial [Bacilli bacterium]|nr:DNA methyltransferase [Bacilli bacterium]